MLELCSGHGRNGIRLAYSHTLFGAPGEEGAGGGYGYGVGLGLS
jgi:hypothetical protein